MGTESDHTACYREERRQRAKDLLHKRFGPEPASVDDLDAASIGTLVHTFDTHSTQTDSWLRGTQGWIATNGDLLQSGSLHLRHATCRIVYRPAQD